MADMVDKSSQYTFSTAPTHQVWLLLFLKIQSDNFQEKTLTDLACNGSARKGRREAHRALIRRGNLTGQDSTMDKVCKAQPQCYFLHERPLLLEGIMWSLKELHASSTKWQLWIVHMPAFLSLSFIICEVGIIMSIFVREINFKVPSMQ